MVGRATRTIETSIVIIPSASVAAASTHQRRVSEVAGGIREG